MTKPFDLDKPLVYFSRNDPWTMRDAFEGTHVYGAVGSGKTSGPGATIFKAFCSAGMGGLCLTAKPGEAQMLAALAKESGREVILFSPDNPYRFGFLAYETRRKQNGAGLTYNIVRLLTTLKEYLEKGKTHNADPFWEASFIQIATSAVDTCVLGRAPLSVSALYEIVTSAPTCHEQIKSEDWQASSTCYRLLEAALNNPDLTERQRLDLKIAGRYFLTEMPGMPSDTRGSIIATFSSKLDIFMRGIMADLFDTKLTITPEITHSGGILIIDLPTKVFGHAGLAAQVLWKHMWQMSIERTKPAVPQFQWIDEASQFCNQHDVDFQSVSARSSQCATVMLCQNTSNYIHAFGERGESLTNSLLGVLGTKIFCANSDPKTNLWAADYFGKVPHFRANVSTSTSDTGNDSRTGGGSEQMDYAVQPIEFLTLLKGGPANGYRVRTIIGQSGRRFSTGDTFIRTSFKQGEMK